jgi:hypothetical protein
MKFDELFHLVVEHRDIVVEEGVKDFLRKIGMLAIAGITWSVPSDVEMKVAKLAENPQKFQEIKTEVDQKLKDPDFVTKLQNLYKTKNSFNQQPIAPVTTTLVNKSSVDEYSRYKNFIDTAMQYIMKHEIQGIGIHTKSYPDNKGYNTIGIGHLIIPSDLKDGTFKPDEVLTKNKKLVKVEISKARAVEIFKKDLMKKLITVRKQFLGFDEYPLSLKVAILDGFFRGDLAGSVTAKKLIKKAMDAYFKGEHRVARVYLKAAAKEYLNSREYKKYSDPKQKGYGIALRMKRNAGEIENALHPNYSLDVNKNTYK